MENENQFEGLNKILEEYENGLSWKRGGSLAERAIHVLGQYRQIADNAIFQSKQFLEDVKTQFKALEIITEGITGQDLNHGQKRVIANHIITTLRRMVDRLDNADFSFTTGVFDRYNFFRSNTPEGRLHERHAELKREADSLKNTLAKLKAKHPDIFVESEDEIPF